MGEDLAGLVDVEDLAVLLAEIGPAEAGRPWPQVVLNGRPPGDPKVSFLALLLFFVSYTSNTN